MPELKNADVSGFIPPPPEIKASEITYKHVIELLLAPALYCLSTFIFGFLQRPKRRETTRVEATG